MKQRVYSSDEKLSVVLEMIKGQKSVVQISKEHGIRDALAYKWKDEALEGMKQSLSDKRSSRPRNNEAEKERLLKIIGQQAVIIDFQKKISQDLSQ
jgi:transposase-like protein